MSGSGNPFDPNQRDGSWYNLFPDGNGLAGTNGLGIDLSPKVGLFGGGYANWLKTQSAPDLIALGAPADFSTDGTGLPPSVTATANLPMHTNPAASLQQVLSWDASGSAPSGDSIKYQNVPAPSDAVDYMLNCMTQYYPGPITVTSTSEPYKDHANPDSPHHQGLAADVKGSDAEGLMQAGANCGAAYQQNEYTHPSENSNGAHVHLQMRPGRGGAVGPYYPLPNLTPWPGR